MKELFASPSFGLIGLIFFFVFFCTVALWTYRPGAKSKYEKNGNIPLQENEE
ncbi:MAG: cbb3-type cytochrome oxidase subunit 3 [Alphaproteobacteria bacterium]